MNIAVDDASSLQAHLINKIRLSLPGEGSNALSTQWTCHIRMLLNTKVAGIAEVVVARKLDLAT